MEEKKILGSELPTLTVKESRRIANIIRNEEADSSSITLASKMGASAKLHSTVETLQEDVQVVDKSIKSTVEVKEVYTTIFDFGAEGTDETADKVVYTTADGEIALVKKSSKKYNFAYKRLYADALSRLSAFLLTCKDSTDPKVKAMYDKLASEVLDNMTIGFNLSPEDKKRWMDRIDDGSLPLFLKTYVQVIEEPTPMFDILFTEKEGGEE